MRGRPDEVNAHEQRKEHSEENAAQGKPEIAHTDRFVAGVEDGPCKKTGSGHLRGRTAAAVVRDHAGSNYTPAGERLEAAREGSDL